MGKRILAMRLKELEAAGFMLRAEQDHAPTRWLLTQKGADVLPVLLTLIHFGSRQRASGGPKPPEGAPLGNAFKVTYSIRGSNRRRVSPNP
jgi:DNA-binding HxlR family transcriptional regulator